MKSKITNYCKECAHIWTKGVQGSWCCKFGKPTKDALGHCKNTNSRIIIVSQN